MILGADESGIHVALVKITGRSIGSSRRRYCSANTQQLQNVISRAAESKRWACARRAACRISCVRSAIQSHCSNRGCNIDQIHVDLSLGGNRIPSEGECRCTAGRAQDVGRIGCECFGRLRAERVASRTVRERVSRRRIESRCASLSPDDRGQNEGMARNCGR